ncbi:MAG: hypothetical protein ACYTDY_05540, partial [Planctomycetota bacterium]
MSVEDAIRKRLSQAADRHRECLKISEDPEVAADHVRAAPILRELGRLTKLADLFVELETVDGDLTEARTLLDSEEDEETR